MNGPKISIIIPIYNVEDYIEETLDSLLNQTIIDDIEVLMIDDGSTDNSRYIIEKYALDYDNFHAFHKENGGQGVARNFGTNKVAEFTPEAPTAPATTKYYVFQFMKKAAVVASPAVYTQITSGTDLTEGKTYYTSSTGEGSFVAGASETADESTYELTTPAVPASPAEYQYKVIKVKAATP